MQMLDRRSGGFFDRIGDDENAGRLSVNRDKHRASALLLKRRGLRFEALETG